jgi:hypothetical protein
MTYGKFRISKKTDEKISRIMVELELERPDVLKIALSKGIFHSDRNIPEKEKIIGEHFREIPISAVCPGDNYLIIKKT